MPEQPAAQKRSEEFLAFIQEQAKRGNREWRTFRDLAGWIDYREHLRMRLFQSLGTMPREDVPLEPRIVGTLKRDGYRVEKVLLNTQPGVVMTANAYVPEREGSEVNKRVPAVLCVHGHWPGAKQDPTVQARCIGLVKLGFFVLVVDAIGAGERAIETALGEYHGEMVGATLLPTGQTLAGLQVYDNRRAVDYLQSRPEVDPKKIGITGASGGGNQSMYAGALDERIGCVVPTCSVGTYQAYLGAACCMCELVPNVMTDTEEWGLLALVAPRALMVTSATRDAFQFSVGEAKKSIEQANTIFEMYPDAPAIKHAVFESKHDYNQAMREAMYGWMSLHLAGVGKGDPIAEPKMQTEEPESLRCFPGESRPKEFTILPQLAHREGKRLLSMRKPADHLEEWEAERDWMRDALGQHIVGPVKNVEARMKTDAIGEDGWKRIHFEVESNVWIWLDVREKPNAKKTVLLLDLEGADAVKQRAWIEKASRQESGPQFAILNLRATGALEPERNKIGRADDHNSAEWSIFVGRPLLGQWVQDVVRTIDLILLNRQINSLLPLDDLTVIGMGPAGVVALAAAAVDNRIQSITTVNSLASYVTDKAYEKQRLGILAPKIMSKVGDIAQLAALCAPRQLSVINPTDAQGNLLSEKEAEKVFAYTQSAFAQEKAAKNFSILHMTEGEVF